MTDQLLMIPGPTRVSPRVARALARPMVAHTSVECAEELNAALAGLAALTGCDGGQGFVFAGSGTLGLEASAVSLVQPGDPVLCISNGFFGDRYAEILSAAGAEVQTLNAPPGECVSPHAVRGALRSGPYAAVCLTHVETATGVMAPVDDLARAVRAESDALLLVDGVCSVGGAQVHMSAWGVDGVIACGQKALGGPPGLTVVQLAQRAVKFLEGAPQRGFYASLGRWLPVMRDPQRYFSTHTVPLVRGLRAAIDEVLAETMPARAARHRRLAERLRDGFRDLGFESAAAPGLEAPTVSALRYPAGVDDAQFRSRMLSRGITVAGALGDWAGSVVRVGHMANIDDTEVEQVLAAARAAVE